jgi:hypothetical protein
MEVKELVSIQKSLQTVGAVDFTILVYKAFRTNSLIVFRDQTVFTPKGFARQLISGKYNNDISLYSIVANHPDIKIDVGDDSPINVEPEQKYVKGKSNLLIEAKKDKKA